MIIIVEGIDRVGKTTLANNISKKYGLKIYKHIGDFRYCNMDNENETDKILQILEIIRISKIDIIFDRLHFTDFVYGCIERNYDFCEALKNKMKIENFLVNNIDTKLIYMNPVNINIANKMHGKNLNWHYTFMNELYKESIIEDKISIDYNSDINEIIDNWIKSKESAKKENIKS